MYYFSLQVDLSVLVLFHSYYGSYLLVYEFSRPNNLYKRVFTTPSRENGCGLDFAEPFLQLFPWTQLLAWLVVSSWYFFSSDRFSITYHYRFISQFPCSTSPSRLTLFSPCSAVATTLTCFGPKIFLSSCSACAIVFLHNNWMKATRKYFILTA